jgi:hypothetical protein
LNAAGTTYTKKNLPQVKLTVPPDAPTQTVGRPYDETDKSEYRVVHVTRAETDRFAKENVNVKPGRYLVNAQGEPQYRTDLPIARESEEMDAVGNAPAAKAPKGFTAPQPALFALITEGILGGKLEWGLVMIGVLVAIAVQLAGVSALPFAVGMYLPLGTSTGIFLGGMLRWVADRARGVSASAAESETSPGVLLASGYIAGGTLVGLVIALLNLLPREIYEHMMSYVDLSKVFSGPGPRIASVVAFAVIGAILVWIGTRKSSEMSEGENASI